jgi:hypothetical protein
LGHPVEQHLHLRVDRHAHLPCLRRWPAGVADILAQRALPDHRWS